MQGNKGHIKSIVFHPQGKWLASIGYDGNIILWSLPDGEWLTQWTIGIEQTLALAASPDGHYLASEGKNHQITLWDVETQQPQQIFEGHQNYISGLDFSPNGDMLASASYDGTARIWQIKTGKPLHQLEFGPDNRVQKVAFSQNGKRLVTSSLDKMVRLWGVESGNLLNVLLGHKETVYSVRFMANDRYLVSASRDNTLRLWDTQSGVTLRVLQGHTASVSGLATFEEQIVSASNDGTIRRWNIALPYQQIVDLSNEPTTVAIAPTGDKIAVGFKNGSLHLYALPNAKHLLWKQLKAHTARVKSLAFSADGKWLASAGYDNTVKIWTLKNNQLIELHKFIYKDIINAVTFSPGTKKLAIAGNDGQVHLLTLKNQQIRTYQAYEQEAVNSLSFFQDQEKNTLSLLTTGDFEVKLWNLNQWENNKPALLQAYPKTINSLAWSALSPDGQQIATVGRDQLVHIYSTTNQSTQYHLEGHESTIFRVIFSPDSNFIVTTGADATLRFWDLENHHELFTLRLPTKNLRPVPLWDFDFQSTPTGCWIAIPLTRSQLILYELGNLYDKV
ncbi:peptidase C14, caspase catalytic subunit p20 [Beggiatoa sp. PS]|nr:peptidase C14, caspase catalytic subunit p20 [Beggiatoa sp. PS]